jgi:hypothetical protein
MEDIQITFPRMAPAESFTPKQGQYLAFISAYTRLHRRPKPTCSNYFRVSPPSVHQMVLTLERAGPIRRQSGVTRNIEILDPEHLPVTHIDAFIKDYNEKKVQKKCLKPCFTD